MFQNIDMITSLITDVETALTSASSISTSITTTLDDIKGISLDFPSNYLKMGSYQINPVTPTLPTLPKFQDILDKLYIDFIPTSFSSDPYHILSNSGTGILKNMMISASTIISNIKTSIGNTLGKAMSVFSDTINSRKYILDWNKDIHQCINEEMSNKYNEFINAREDAIRDGNKEIELLWNRAIKFHKEKQEEITTKLNNLNELSMSYIDLMEKTRPTITETINTLNKSIPTWCSDCNYLTKTATGALQ